MAVLTADQVTDIHAAIDAVQKYVDTLQDALGDASAAGNMGAATSIETRYDDAQLLESQLKGLLTLSAAESLQAAVLSLSNTTNVLQQQKTQIDAVVAAIGTAATVLGDIAAIASHGRQTGRDGAVARTSHRPSDSGRGRGSRI